MPHLLELAQRAGELESVGVRPVDVAPGPLERFVVPPQRQACLGGGGIVPRVGLLVVAPVLDLLEDVVRDGGRIRVAGEVDAVACRPLQHRDRVDPVPELLGVRGIHAVVPPHGLFQVLMGACGDGSAGSDVGPGVHVGLLVCPPQQAARLAVLFRVVDAVRLEGAQLVDGAPQLALVQ